MSRLGSVALVARAEVRGRRATIAIIVAVAALVSGATLTAAAGARRTATVVDRMLAEQNMPAYGVGTYLTTGAGDPARLRAAQDALAELDGVDQAFAIANIYVAIGPQDGSWYLSIGTNLDGGYLESGWNPPLRDGRLPAVDATGEVAFDEATASRLDLAVGDVFEAPTISVATTEALMRGEDVEPRADGPELTFTVVGIFRESVTDDPSYGFGLASPDTARYLGEAGVSDAYFLIDGEDIDVQQAVDTVSSTVGGSSYFADPELELTPIRDTVHIIATGLALFAGLAAIAGLIALGQVVGRQVADGERLAGVTSSLGMRSNETALAVAIPAAIAGAVGTVVGAIVAAALSPIFPTGLGRRAEPSPGVRIDWPVLVVGSLVLVAFVAASAIVSARRRVRAQRGSSRTVGRRRRSGLRRGLPVPAALGSGLVLVPNRVRSAVRPASALLGTLLGVTGVLAIAVFTVSQRATADDPIRYGWSWDVDADIPFDDPEPLFAALADDPSFSAVGVANCGQAKIRDDDTLLCAMEVLSGSMPLTYLAGRAPASPDEVVAGEMTMADHDLSVGDRVEVSGDAGVEKRLEVVGVAVMPDTSRPGRGLVTTPDGLRELSGSDNFFPIVTLTYAPGLDRADVEAVLADDYGLTPDELTYASPPALVTRLDLVRPTLVALALFLGALGVIGMVHFLMLSNARRRRETAVLEAIGFVRAQTIAVVASQALTIATIGVLLGAPLGVIIGRTAWTASIDQLGIVDNATVPWRFCALVAAAVLVGAGAIGSLTGWRASRRSPAVPLRQE